MTKYITLLTLSFLSSISILEAKGFDPGVADEKQLGAQISKLKNKMSTAKGTAEGKLFAEQIEALSSYMENRKMPEWSEEDKATKNLLIGTAIEAYYNAKENRKVFLKKEKEEKFDPFAITNEVFGEVEYTKVLSNFKAEQKHIQDKTEQELLLAQIDALSSYLEHQKLFAFDAEEEEFNTLLKNSALDAYYQATEKRAQLKNKKDGKEEIPLDLEKKEKNQVPLKKKVIRAEAPASPVITWDILEELFVDETLEEKNGNKWEYLGGAFGGALTGKTYTAEKGKLGEVNKVHKNIIPSGPKAELITEKSLFAKMHPKFVDQYAVAYHVDGIDTPFFLVLKENE